MKYLIWTIAFFAMPLMAQDIPNPYINEGTMETPTCETYVEWTGKPIREIDLSILDNRPYRILKPDSIVTMDYSPDRLNIHTDNDGIILQQDCG